MIILNLFLIYFMRKIIINLVKLSHLINLLLPEYEPFYDTKIDLVAAVHKNLLIKPFQKILIPTGIIALIAEGFEGQLMPKPFFFIRNNIIMVNAFSIIKFDHKKEIKIIFTNLSNDSFIVQPGMFIAKLIIKKKWQSAYIIS